MLDHSIKASNRNQVLLLDFDWHGAAMIFLPKITIVLSAENYNQ